jgi:hypothetical protein
MLGMAGAVAGSADQRGAVGLEVVVMLVWLLASVLVVSLCAAAWRYGVGGHDDEDRHTRRRATSLERRAYGPRNSPHRDLVAVYRVLRRVTGDLRELDERRALLDRPWEEDFLHWAHDEQGWHMHGHLVPPPRRRGSSVTSRGWCPGLSTAEVSAAAINRRTS